MTANFKWTCIFARVRPCGGRGTRTPTPHASRRCAIVRKLRSSTDAHRTAPTIGRGGHDISGRRYGQPLPCGAMRLTQRKGDLAVAQAIATFTRLGYDIAIPLTESAAYDLVVDIGGELRRVQVRYTSSRQVDLRRIHSNSNGYVVKKTKPDAYDWLYVLNDRGEEYLLKECLHTRRSWTPESRFLVGTKSTLMEG